MTRRFFATIPDLLGLENENGSMRHPPFPPFPPFAPVKILFRSRGVLPQSVFGGAPASRPDSAMKTHLTLGRHVVTIWECALKNRSAREWLIKKIPKFLATP